MQPQNGLHSMESAPAQQSAVAALDPSWGYDLNLLSHAASHVASNQQYEISGLPQVTQEQLQEPLQQLMPSVSEPQYQPRMLTEGYGHP